MKRQRTSFNIKEYTLTLWMSIEMWCRLRKQSIIQQLRKINLSKMDLGISLTNLKSKPEMMQIIRQYSWIMIFHTINMENLNLKNKTKKDWTFKTKKQNCMFQITSRGDQDQFQAKMVKEMKVKKSSKDSIRTTVKQ